MKKIEKARKARKECCYVTKKDNKNSITSELCSYSGNSKIVVFTIHYNNENYLNAKEKIMLNYGITQAY
jgi:hypothetical protein